MIFSHNSNKNFPFSFLLQFSLVLLVAEIEAYDYMGLPVAAASTTQEHIWHSNILLILTFDVKRSHQDFHIIKQQSM